MATVYLMELRKKYNEDVLRFFDRLVDTAGGMKVVQKKSPAAVKLHVGESGNVNYVNPRYVNRLTELIGEAGGTSPSPVSMALILHR
jgi:uncharacterized Fe-S center protein